MASQTDDARRPVVTGMGIVSPLGMDLDGVWNGLLEKRTGVGPMPYFDVSEYPAQFAACVRDFDVAPYVDSREAKRMARFTQFAVAAAQRAVAHAGLDLSACDPTRVGAEIGSAVGGLGLIEQQSIAMLEKGPRKVNPTLVPMVIVNMAACQVSICLGLKGPVASPVAACATGLVAIGEAARRLQFGEADVMLAGGTESVDTPVGMAAFARLGALSTLNEAPERACRPFDLNRDGTVLGEGAAVLVLETLAHARARGAAILGEVMGYGLTGDAYHVAAPEPSGDGAARAIQAALRASKLNPEDVDYIAAHGTGTPLNDLSETLAIKTALGAHAYRIPISSNKPAVGHMLGAAGAFSVAVVLMTIQHNVVPPTANLETPDPACDLDYVPGGASPGSSGRWSGQRLWLWRTKRLCGFEAFHWIGRLLCG